MTSYLSSWEQHYSAEEANALGAAMTEAITALLAWWDVQDFASLDRRVYKTTACGASIGLELHDGGFVWSGDPRLATTPPMEVRAIGVGSIVEGTDRTVEHEFIDLLDYAERDADDFVTAFGKLVDQVDEAAQEAWNDTHGCPHCGTGDAHVEDGPCPTCRESLLHGSEHPIDPDCTYCDGEGNLL